MSDGCALGSVDQYSLFFFFQAEDGIRDLTVTGVQTCALPICFQLFSLAQMTKVTEEGAVFRSHIDGSLLELTPERAVQIQEDLGSDVAMVLEDRKSVV